ncbi:MAG: HAD family phosphatase [Actinobacteria bacterium]|nr:HAD family phosphatase [Actinomycetota bacterium]
MPTREIPTGFFAAILFDMDGTLVDTEPYWLEAETELMADYGYAWTRQDQGNCLGGPISRVGEYMYPLSGNQQSPEFFTNSLVDRMVQKLKRGVALMDGAHELLSLCNEIKLPIALVSASPRILVDAATLEIKNAKFGITISADDVERVKPDPQGYLNAAEHLGVNIAQCLILEDSYNGVLAAMASGAWVVAIPHLVPIRASERVAVVASIEELSLQKIQALYAKWNF